MIFQMKAKVEFEAENIDDAFLFLEEYFKALRCDDDPKEILAGEINIEPISEE